MDEPKDRKHNIISVDLEKAFEKNLTSLHNECSHFGFLKEAAKQFYELHCSVQGFEKGIDIVKLDTNILPQENIVHLLLFPTLLLDIALKNRSGVVAHALNPSTGETVRQISDWRLPGLQSEIQGSQGSEETPCLERKRGTGGGYCVCMKSLSFFLNLFV